MLVHPQLIMGLMKARKPIVSNNVVPIEITFRRAAHGDEGSLLRLAGLDSARPLAGEILIAVAGDKPVAAISLTDGRVVADPFERTADLVELLRVRARQVLPATPAQAGRRRVATLEQAS